MSDKRETVWKYLKQLQDSCNTTIFVTTHYMEADSLCDRVAIMHRGRVAASSTPMACCAMVKDRMDNFVPCKPPG